MSEERICKICKSELEPVNPTNICLNCQSNLIKIETKIDGLALSFRPE